MKLAFMYAGQGAQKARMGLDLYEQYPQFSKTIDVLQSCVDFDLKRVMFGEDDSDLNQTEMTQPSLAAYAAGVTAVLKAHGIQPDLVLGLSLGEYSALHAAGALTSEELVELTAFRGQEMAKAGAGIETNMCAILGLTSDVTEAVCREAEEECGSDDWVSVVNYNAIGQEVISGTKHAVALAMEKAKAAGAKRCMILKVSSAFHTHLMEDASKALKKRLKRQRLHELEVPVIFNVTGRELKEDETIPELLELQVKRPVKMRQSIEMMKASGVTHVIEIGPGHALSGFVKRTVSGIRTYAVEDAASMEEVLQQFGSGKE